MASILRVNTITDASSNNSVDTSVLFNGTAKMWVNYNSNDGTPAIQDSYNATSITDNGTGDYTFTIANDMANSTYVVNVATSDANTNTSVLVGVTQGASLTTGLFKIYILNEDSGVSDGADPNGVSVLGDLA